MRVREQTTLKKASAVSGVALHTGAHVRMTIRPAPVGAGIRFRRIDLRRAESARSDHDITIVVSPRAVSETRLGVALENVAGVSVRTVEHVLAALSLSGVDNALLELDGPEAPILDGSAAPFMEMIERAGIQMLASPREAIEVKTPLRVEAGDRFVEVTPAEGREVEVSIDFEDQAIGKQAVAFSLDSGNGVISRLSAARTFCNLKDVESMRAAGLSLGGSLDNSIVVDGHRLLNPSGLRDPKEFVLHKALDLVGDLSLLGAPLIGRICAHKPGHELNTLLARRILEETGSSERRVIPFQEPIGQLSA